MLGGSSRWLSLNVLARPAPLLLLTGVVNRPWLAKTGKYSLNHCGRTGTGILNFEMANLGNGNLIGRNVSRLRYQQSWTQEELAAKMQLLGCYTTRDIIANIENRRSSANDKQIAFLAEALNVEIGDLFPKNPTKSFTSHVASP